MIKSLDVIITPACWPKLVRRAFLLTLPISGPVWLILMFLLGFVTLVAQMVYVLWTGKELI